MSLVIDIQCKRNSFFLSFEASMDAGITGLFGPSGSGKTTLLHCIAGLMRPDRGRIELNHNVIYDDLLKIHLPPRKRRIGLVFQDNLLFPHLTTRGNLSYGQKGPKKHRKEQLCEIADLLEIAPLLDRNIHQLSGGQKQRVALGRAILSAPKLLLLDEPFTALDAGLKRQIMSYLRRLYERTRIPMVLVSHNPQELTQLADELLFIENGKRYAQGKFNTCRKGQSVGRICGSKNPMISTA